MQRRIPWGYFWRKRRPNSIKIVGGEVVRVWGGVGSLEAEIGDVVGGIIGAKIYRYYIVRTYWTFLQIWALVSVPELYQN